jgi:hypothetical protein
MKTHVNTHIKESAGAVLKACIYQSNEGYSIEYEIDGDTVGTEMFPNKSIFYVESAASNWLAGIKKLNG